MEARCGSVYVIMPLGNVVATVSHFALVHYCSFMILGGTHRSEALVCY